MTLALSQTASSPHTVRTTPFAGLIALLAIATLVGGCAKTQPAATTFPGIGLTASPVSAGAPAATSDVRLSAAGNEWTSFTVDLHGLPAGAARGQLAIALAPLVGPAPLELSPSDVEAFQLVDLPVDVNRATAIRSGSIGAGASDARLPRALLPLPADGPRFGLATLRAGNTPTTGPASSSARVWLDVHLPKKAPAGRYQTACQLLAQDTTGKTPTWRTLAAVPVELTVHNFSIADRRNLLMVGQVSWESLVRHYGDDFEAVTPHLVNRTNPKYAGTIRTLDALMRLAQHNRVSIAYPRLQPYVNWPAKGLLRVDPEITWTEFDGLVGPWMNGSAFPNGVGVGYWPLPEPDRLRSYETESKLAYWSLAASHFNQHEWLLQSPVMVRKDGVGRVRAADAIELSIEAAQLLAKHPDVQVSVPLEEDQVQIENAKQPNLGGAKLIDPLHTGRLRVAAPGLIGAPQHWPAEALRPKRWLRTDLPGLVPVAGVGGTEQDVRVWAWLSFLRQCQQVMFGQALPAEKSPSDLADPLELAWFYPGQWFGLDQPVPSVQLKWLRRAEQDYEYLHLAGVNSETVNAMVMARLLTKPVEVGLGQAPDSAYTLMTGTTEPQVWSDARELLARLIELYSDHPDGKADQAAKQAAEIAILQWARPQERPLLIGRTANWSWGKQRSGAQWVELSLGLDVYNAADVAPGSNTLRWRQTGPGWQVKPQPQAVPPLVPYRVLRTSLPASFNVGKTVTGTQEALELELSVDSPTARFSSPIRLSLPIAGCDRRVEGRFSFDGKLDDWSEIDLIHDAPLVKMLSRPAVLAQTLEQASTTSQLYTNYHLDNLYFAFALDGVSKGDAAGAGNKNFVDYQHRRAWGEDLCELLIQPIYADNALGPILHVVCKPNGSSWVERKLDPLLNADPWEPYESTGTRYAAVTSGGKWTGELAIPWKALDDSKRGRPTLLRFNFSQHRAANGESASWAGPVDFGRDDALTGLLHLKLPIAGNPGDAVQGGAPQSGLMER